MSICPTPVLNQKSVMLLSVVGEYLRASGQLRCTVSFGEIGPKVQLSLISDVSEEWNSAFISANAGMYCILAGFIPIVSFSLQFFLSSFRPIINDFERNANVLIRVYQLLRRRNHQRKQIPTFG